MFHKRSLIAVLIAALVPATGRAQRDTAHHSVRYITVQRGVKLHTLDFGGTGPTLLFLAGLGNTAHAWDEFAPAFTDRFHVIAITRRGFGESDHPKTGYDIPRLAADIKAVLDSLHVSRVSIAGHSIAGEEMTRFAATYPDRVDELVFLDAAYDRVRASALVENDSVPAPDGESVDPPTEADTLSPAAYVAYQASLAAVVIVVLRSATAPAPSTQVPAGMVPSRTAWISRAQVFQAAWSDRPSLASSPVAGFT